MATNRHRILVSFTQDEMTRVRAFSQQLKLSISETMRRLILGANLPSPQDFAANEGIRDLLKVNADQARLGNLLKLTLDDGDWPSALVVKVERLIDDLAATQADLKAHVHVKVLTPHRDFFTLDRVKKEVEQKYGLVVDHGMEKRDRKSPGLSAAAKDYETKTWQQSYESHLLDHKIEILSVVKQATSWAELHKGLAKYDAELKKRGAGLVFKQITGKRTMKASALDRSCSLKTLEDRFGPYQPPPIKAVAIELHEILPKRPYQAKPLTRHPAMDRLWRNFVTGGKAPPKKPGVIKRLLHPRNWRDYLMAEVHKDMLALAIVLTYKELFYTLGLGPDSGGRSQRPAAYMPPTPLTR